MVAVVVVVVVVVAAASGQAGGLCGTVIHTVKYDHHEATANTNAVVKIIGNLLGGRCFGLLAGCQHFAHLLLVLGSCPRWKWQRQGGVCIHRRKEGVEAWLDMLYVRCKA